MLCSDNVKNNWRCHPFKAIQMWSITAIFIVMQFFLLTSIGVITLQLREALLLDAFELSIISSAYYVIYFLLQIPAGVLIDRFGSRLLLTCGALICSTGCLFFAIANGICFAVFGRLLMGMGMAFSFISSLNIASKWFPKRYFTVMTGLAEGVAMLGALSGNLILAGLLKIITWRFFYEILTVIMLVLALIAWFLLRDSPNEIQHPYKKSGFYKLMINLKSLIKNSSMWLIGIYAGLSYSSVTVYGALWGIPFLMKVHRLSHYTATFAVSLVFLGLAIGAPVINWKFGKHLIRKYIMVFNPVILCIFMFVLIYFYDLNLYLICVICFALGFFSGSLILSYTLTTEIAPKRARNTGVGVTNMLALATAPIFQAVVGFILERRSNCLSVKNIEIYTAEDYKVAFGVLLIVTLIAALLACFFKDDKIHLPV